MRVIFLIDGFNLYHSVLQIEKDTGYCTKWLDISSLCKSYLHLFGKKANLEDIFYFSAIPYYLNNTNPNKILRHKKYITCLKSTNIQTILGRFKEKTIYCNKCKSWVLHREEKETDVAIGVKLMEIFFRNECDIAILFSGDTDLTPALKECQSLFNNKKVMFAFPYKRKNKELDSLAPDSFSLNYKQYIKYQFPNPVTLKSGLQIYKPSKW